MIKKNKVVRLTLAGGLIGLLGTNPRRALDNEIDRHNQDGWNAIEFQPHLATNMLIRILQFLVLVCTLGIWTWGAGYLILFERETA
jgi:hypothetical protein